MDLRIAFARHMQAPISVFFGSLMVYVLYALNVFALGWAFIPFAILLFIFGWTVGFLSSGLVIYWGPKLKCLLGCFRFIPPFSAVFYPVEVLPAWAQYISWSLPTTYVFEGMRQILNGSSFPFAYFWASLGLNLIFLFGSALFFRIMFYKSLVKGLGRLE